jgi:hypothetical protein
MNLKLKLIGFRSYIDPIGEKVKVLTYAHSSLGITYDVVTTDIIPNPDKEYTLNELINYYEKDKL